MTINFYGQTCFKINTQKNKDGSLNVLIDPFGKETGLNPPKMEADVVLFSNNQENLPSLSGVFLVKGPGEYEIKEVFIYGIPAKGSTIYTIEAEDMKICHLGALSQKELTTEQLEKIGQVDILMVPVGGDNSLLPEEALKIMSQIEPKIVIPMYYKLPKLKSKLETIDKFLKAVGVKSIQPLPKLSIKKKDISEEEVKILTLEV